MLTPSAILGTQEPNYILSLARVSASHTGVLVSLTGDFGSHTVYLRSHFAEYSGSCWNHTGDSVNHSWYSRSYNVDSKNYTGD